VSGYNYTEMDVAAAVWRKWGVKGLSAPNIHHFAFESDVLVLRDSGTLIEYEIKLTKADYMNDFKKKARINPNNKNNRAPQIFINEKGLTTRHEYLQSGLGANMFYYVLPTELIERVEVPEFAGIISVRETNSTYRCRCALRRKAKMLHKDKFGDAVKKKIHQSLYYRYWQNFSQRCVVKRR
jgi:hypothetical protein